jgi:hypothetical protein
MARPRETAAEDITDTEMHVSLVVAADTRAVSDLEEHTVITRGPRYVPGVRAALVLMLWTLLTTFITYIPAILGPAGHVDTPAGL